jgi:hypothetical protein
MDKARANGNIHIRASVEAMQASSSDERGTVQALAREVEEDAQDGTCKTSSTCSSI